MTAQIVEIATEASAIPTKVAIIEKEHDVTVYCTKCGKIILKGGYLDDKEPEKQLIVHLPFCHRYQKNKEKDS